MGQFGCFWKLSFVRDLLLLDMDPFGTLIQSCILLSGYALTRASVLSSCPGNFDAYDITIEEMYPDIKNMELTFSRATFQIGDHPKTMRPGSHLSEIVETFIDSQDGLQFQLI